MRTRLLVVVLVVAGAAWFVSSPTWVRPAALAIFAVTAAAVLWGRSGRAKRPAPEPDESAPRPEAAKEMWDALDRGEDPTTR